MSVTKICVVALLLCASAVTARILNKREVASRDFRLNDVLVGGNTEGTEEEKCDCGEYGITCKMENGTKVCTCIFPYQDNRHGVCIPCDCGSDLLLDCSYDENINKICTCRKGYLKGPDDMCQKSCSTQDPCDNGGKCVNSLCQCLPGTRGDKCEIVEPCTDSGKLWEKCGFVMGVKCIFNQTSRTSYCGCTDDREGYDVRERYCKKKCANDDVCQNGGKCVDDICKCLPGTKGDKCEIIEKCVTRSDVDERCGDSLTLCRFNQTSLKPYCTCILLHQYGYNAQLKKCKECNCGDGSHGCMFQERNGGEKSEEYEKICKCNDGYAQNNKGQCQAIPSGGSKTGTSSPNTSLETDASSPNTNTGTVTTETPSSSSATESISPNTTPGTDASSPNTTPGTDGSSPNTTPGTDGSSPNTTPGTDGSSPNTTPGTVASASTGWRTSTIVLGILLAICLIGLAFGLYKLRNREYRGV